MVRRFWGIFMRWMQAVGMCALMASGCVTGPRLDNPALVNDDSGECQNPVLIFPDQTTHSYADVFDRVLDVIDDNFEIAYANRYEGRILGKPTFAPGFEQWWKPGSPDKYERALVTLQAYRYRCEVRIREAHPSGYFVHVFVRKELKDYSAPATPYQSTAIFGDLGTVDRDRFVVVDPEATTPLSDGSDRWIPKGRDGHIEQIILRKLQKCQ